MERIIALLGKYKYPVLILLVGLGLMLLPSGGEAPAPAPEPAETAEAADLESRLEEILAGIDGAGQVRVLLTEEAGREHIYQTDSDIRSDSQTHDTVLVEDASNCETGLIRRTLEPSYRGAVILCQGADSSAVRLAVVEAVRCVTGLGADAISVLKMK